MVIISRARRFSKYNNTKMLFIIAHILASTELTCCSKKDEFLSDEALIEKNAVEIVKQMQVCKQFM